MGTDLAATAAIEELLIRYTSGLDRKDGALLRTCFTDDCTSDFGALGSWSSGEELTEYMRAAHAELGHTLHRLSNVTAQVDGDRATARSYVDAVIMYADNQVGVQLIGRYDDELVHGADGWRISRRVYTLVLMRNIAVEVTLPGA